MRKLMLAIALAGSQWLSAQNPKDSLSQKLSQIFAQIDPGLVASGRIYDKGFALTNPLYFSASNTEKVDGSFSQFGMPTRKATFQMLPSFIHA